MFRVSTIARHAAFAWCMAVALAGGSSLAAQGLRAPMDASYIVGNDAVSRVARSYVEIDMVRSAVDGIVEIREDRAGGALLGQAPVHAGANPSFRIRLSRRPSTDVVAVLRNGDSIVATADLERDF